MPLEIVTFGCRLNTYESEVMRREAEAAGLARLEDGAVIFNTCAVTAEAVRQARQAISKARRRTRKRGSSSPAAPRRPTRQALPQWPKSISCSATRKSSAPQLPGASGFRRQRFGESPRQRHFLGARNRRPYGRRHRGTRPRLRAGAEWLRSPLHLLHHPLWPRQFPLGADGRRRRAGRAAGRQRLRGNRAVGRRSHQLRGRSARQAEARQAGAGASCGRFRSSGA